MNIRKLFAIVIALSVLFAPGVTGAALASVPGHHMPMMAAGHCQMPRFGSADHGKGDGKSCCISMCMRLAIAPSTPLIGERARNAPAVFTVPGFHLDHPGELPTPPPKLS